MEGADEIVGLEALNVMNNRIMEFLQDIKKRGNGRYLIVTHGGVIITLLSLLSRGELNWENSPIGNCSLTSIKFNSDWEISYINRSIRVLNK